MIRLTALAGIACLAVASIGGGERSVAQSREAGTMPDKTIEAVLEENTDTLMSIPGVVGTAQGECEGAPCIKVYVAKKTADLLTRIPSTIDGYSISVVESGPIRAF